MQVLAAGGMMSVTWRQRKCPGIRISLSLPRKRLLAVLVALIVGAAPDPAWALSITSVTCLQQLDNVLRYDCNVRTDTKSNARGNLMLFDNHLDDDPNPSTSRGIEIDLLPDTSEYDVVSEWDSTYNCAVTGSNFDLLPSGNAVVTCSGEDLMSGPDVNPTIQEFDTSGGSPVWQMELSSTPGSAAQGKVYRGRPLTSLDVQ